MFLNLFRPKPDFGAYRLGTCKTPTDLASVPLLKLAGKRFTAPATVDLRDYCTKTDDQGETPWCAAYSAANWAENILWRKNDYIQEIDAAKIYREAKKIDGDPEDGTTLIAVMQVLLNEGYFDKNLCKIATLQGGDIINQYKYAIHKFGACLLGFNITDEWYDICNGKEVIKGGKGYKSEGGHAVLGCGYTRDGAIIQNSWGEQFGKYGFCLVKWSAFFDQAIYGSITTHCLDNMKMN